MKHSLTESEIDEKHATFLAYEELKPSHLDIQEDFTDITPLWDPPSGEAAVDIVAVLGFNTKAEMAFRTKSQAGVINGEIWLRDYLHHDVGNARVLLYGYKSRVPEGDSTATSDQMAYALISELIWIRKETNTENRPMILLGHGFGGILIKEMIQQLFKKDGSRTPRDTALYHSCKGFIFYEISRNQALGNISNDRLPQESLNVFTRSPQYFTSLQENFHRAIFEQPKLPGILAFHETEPSSPMQGDPRLQVEPTARYFSNPTPSEAWVERDLGVSESPRVSIVRETSEDPVNIDYRSQPLRTVQSDLVKFPGRNDPNYTAVLYHIRGMVLRVARHESISNGKRARSQEES
ncbi:hypothetical protein BDV97DRAFT_397488 [Delphinella strobiligena]|nr:hypothetical protein BDV97DRAFT_397488 [Delphinella strobiligena]